MNWNSLEILYIDFAYEFSRKFYLIQRTDTSSSLVKSYIIELMFHCWDCLDWLDNCEYNKGLHNKAASRHCIQNGWGGGLKDWDVIQHFWYICYWLVILTLTCCKIHLFSLIYLFNSISTLYGLFNAKICTSLIITITIFGLVDLFNGISTPYGLFKAEIWFICKCLIIIITNYIFNVPLQFF